MYLPWRPINDSVPRPFLINYNFVLSMWHISLFPSTLSYIAKMAFKQKQQRQAESCSGHPA